jgi:YesN/AraC family two-component response regulator
MPKKPVYIFADDETEELRQALSLTDERIEVRAIEKIPECLQRGDADAVVLDCGFEPRDGLLLLSEIKSAAPHVPVIFVTDKGSEEIAVQAFRRGAIDYFKKPVNIQLFKSAVENVLKIARTHSEERPYIDKYTGDGQAPSLSLSTDMPVSLLRAVRYIERHLSTRLRLEELAKEARLSKYHFCRVFKRHTGISAKEFVTRVRIERAKELLARRDDHTITMIAAKVGFISPTRFSMYFKKLTGVSPSSYKLSCKVDHCAILKS